MKKIIRSVSYFNFIVRDFFNNLPSLLAPFVALLFSVAFIMGLLMTTGYFDTHYTTIATVLKNENNSTFLVDGAGYVWEVVDRPELHKGDFVEIKFFNNTTDYTREDDEIIKITLLDN